MVSGRFCNFWSLSNYKNNVFFPCKFLSGPNKPNLSETNKKKLSKMCPLKLVFPIQQKSDLTSRLYMYLIYKDRTQLFGSNVLSSPSTECFKTSHKNSQWPAHGLRKRNIPKSSIQKLQLSFQVVVHVSMDECYILSLRKIYNSRYRSPGHHGRTAPSFLDHYLQSS